MYRPKKHKIRIFIFLLIIISYVNILYSQNNDLPDNKTVPESTENKEKDNEKSRTVNIDAKMMYGQYNNILSSFSIIQNFDKFTYQLNSDFKRSNDFGYENSSFYEGEIGFTGKSDITDSWKFIPQLEVDNESHGMFDNTNYSREEKDKVIVTLKNEYKSAPSRWDFNFGGAQYVHRLVTTDPIESNFYKINADVGWEYIWSSSFNFTLKAYYSQYDYSSVKDDRFFSNEVGGSLKVTEYIKFGLFYTSEWNRDIDPPYHYEPSVKVSFTSVGLKYTSLELTYKYDLVPFKPEDFNFEQKYIYPTYDLPPSRIHHVDLKSEFAFNMKKKKKNFSVKRIKLKCSGFFEKNNNFYNYYPLQENVLSADIIPVMFFNLKGDLILDLNIFSSEFQIGVNYEYYHYLADENITYRPDHTIGALAKYSNKTWVIEWNNKFIDEVYVNPGSNIKLRRAIIGTLDFQFRIAETFFLFVKADNIYNVKYSYRYGYSEPGRIILGGLRIII